MPRANRSAPRSASWPRLQAQDRRAGIARRRGHSTHRHAAAARPPADALASSRIAVMRRRPAA
jgi:hypothetical protein